MGASCAAVLALLLAQEGAAARAMAAPPNVDLASAFFSRAAGAGRRTVMTNVLRLTTSLEAQPVFAGLSWVTLVERGGGGARHTVTVPGNLVLGLSWPFGLASPWPAEISGGLVADLSRRSLATVAAPAAYAHALALHGGWEPWWWAPGRPGAFLSGRLARAGARGGPVFESALAVFAPRGEALQSSTQVMVQASLEYAWWARAWLSLAPALRTTWMPSIGWSTSQSALAARATARTGRWRLSAAWIANLDAPYGWTGGGQRIGALHLQAAVWL